MLLSSLFLIVIALRRGVSTISVGDKVDNWVKHPSGNPEELGDFFEGDILLPNRQRAALRNKDKRWPNGTIPYIMVGFTPHWHGVILNAMNTISTRTCIKFRPKRPHDKHYVLITSNRKGCYSFVGRIGGSQVLNLQVPGCVLMIGTIMHELLHTVGFVHEQSRYDRNDYVEILWENIQKGKERNFRKESAKNITHLGFGYDYSSVMHYSGNAFSKNGKRTIIIKGTKKKIILGQRHSLTDLDVRKVNTMYKCKRKLVKVSKHFCVYRC